MKVRVASILPCPVEKVWDEVQKSSLLEEVTHPLVRFVPVDGREFPERWIEGTTIRCKFYVFGFIPVGTHTIFFERIDAAAGEIQSREKDPLIRRWDHLARVKPAGENRTAFSDEIDIDAGALTILVWMFAHWFYRHRQRRWQRVAQRLASAASRTAA